mgnify:CR=1 FL=1|eukprot:scaffold234224_cov34-Tisochrysis_lutea.AAC.2
MAQSAGVGNVFGREQVEGQRDARIVSPNQRKEEWHSPLPSHTGCDVQAGSPQQGTGLEVAGAHAPAAALPR